MRHDCPVTYAVIAMLVSVVAAGAVLALVALPRLREGDRVLTRDGREAVEDAARRARAIAARRGHRVGDGPSDGQPEPPGGRDGAPTRRS